MLRFAQMAAQKGGAASLSAGIVRAFQVFLFVRLSLWSFLAALFVSSSIRCVFQCCFVSRMSLPPEPPHRPVGLSEHEVTLVLSIDFKGVSPALAADLCESAGLRPDSTPEAVSECGWDALHGAWLAWLERVDSGSFLVAAFSRFSFVFAAVFRWPRDVPAGAPPHTNRPASAHCESFSFLYFLPGSWAAAANPERGRYSVIGVGSEEAPGGANAVVDEYFSRIQARCSSQDPPQMPSHAACNILNLVSSRIFLINGGIIRASGRRGVAAAAATDTAGAGAGDVKAAGKDQQL